MESPVSGFHRLSYGRFGIRLDQVGTFDMAMDDVAWALVRYYITSDRFFESISLRVSISWIIFVCQKNDKAEQ